MIGFRVSTVWSQGPPTTRLSTLSSIPPRRRTKATLPLLLPVSWRCAFLTTRAGSFSASRIRLACSPTPAATSSNTSGPDSGRAALYSGVDPQIQRIWIRILKFSPSRIRTQGYVINFERKNVKK